MVVQGDLQGVNAQLLPGVTDVTTLSVHGTIGSGNWTVAQDANVFAAGVVDLDGAPPGADQWYMNGRVNLQQAAYGDGDWTVENVGEPIPILNCPYSFEADSLVVRGLSNVRLGGNYNYDNVLHIKELLVADASPVEQLAGWLWINQGSAIQILNGGIVRPHTIRPVWYSIVGSMEYGLPGASANEFLSVFGVRFAYPDAALKKLAGPESQMRMTVIGTGVAIASKVHEEAGDWDASGVALEIYVDGWTGLEANSPDLDGIWFADSACIKPWGRLDVWGPVATPLELENTEDNSNAMVLADTGEREAVYVDDDITLYNGAEIETQILNVYFSGTLSKRRRAFCSAC